MQVNVESAKDAICSAVDVMQAMASSICLLLPKVIFFHCVLFLFPMLILGSCARIMLARNLLTPKRNCLENEMCYCIRHLLFPKKK